MKRSLLITAGIIVILLVLGIWIYLMLFGAPKNSGEVFTNFGFAPTERPVEIVDTVGITEPEYTIDVQDSRLQQLTTKAVAGFVGTVVASSSVVRYVEQGTGHIYQIDLESGNEEMISKTTIPRVQSAIFSPEGKLVAITSATGYTKDTYFASINKTDGKLAGINLPPNAENIYLDNDSVFYTYFNGSETIGYTQDLNDNTQELFRLPFRFITMLWRENGSYFYNKPAQNLLGYLYKIENGTYVGTPVSGYGLTVVELTDQFGFSKYDENQLSSWFYDLVTGEIIPSPIPVIAEKCAISVYLDIFCGSPLENKIVIDDWYKGKINIEDYLWYVDVVENQGVLLENLTKTAGRGLDVFKINIDSFGANLFFSNKIDSTLWRYKL